MPYKRVCKNHCRMIVRDAKGEPVRDKDGAIVTTAWPRGKAYPYSSVRQQMRDRAKSIAANQREIEKSLDWMMDEVRSSLGTRRTLKWTPNGHNRI